MRTGDGYDERRGTSIAADNPASASGEGNGRPNARLAQASPIAALVWMP